jgi:predicted HAD superfamily Cof-like phosphohydrolase
MKSNYDLVCEFNKAFDYKVYNIHEGNPLELNKKEAEYRYNLIHEEGIEELGLAIKTHNRIEIMDAIADLLYVLYGACYTYNLNPDYILKDIDFNDLKKHIHNLDNNYNDYYNDLIIVINKIKYCLLESKNILELYALLIDAVINTYKLGFCLRINVDKVFNIVHESNMSKLCVSEEEAILTVNWYINKRKLHNESYDNNVNNYGVDSEQAKSVYCPYDSPYYYKSGEYWLVKNKSTGKALKSINYKPVNL